MCVCVCVCVHMRGCVHVFLSIGIYAKFCGVFFVLVWFLVLGCCFVCLFVCFSFLGLHSLHMEVPRLGVESEL